MLVHKRHVALSCCTFNLSSLSKTKTWRIWKRVLMMTKSKYLNFHLQSNTKEMKQKKKQFYYRHKYLCSKITFCALFYALFLHCLRNSFQPFCQWKKFLSSGNKVFREDVNFIKKINFNWETFQFRKWKFFVWNIAMMIKCGF